MSDIYPEQNPAWSEEDARLFNNICLLIRKEAYIHYDVDENGKECGEYAEIKRWFESLKDRVQPKQELSCEKEQDENINNINWPKLSNCIKDCKKCQCKCFYRKECYQQNTNTDFWNKQAEEIIMWLVRLINTAGYRELETDQMPCSRYEMTNWLKSLKDRVQPQNLTVTDEELAKYAEKLPKVEK